MQPIHPAGYCSPVILLQCKTVFSRKFLSFLIYFPLLCSDFDISPGATRGFFSRRKEIKEADTNPGVPGNNFCGSPESFYFDQLDSIIVGIQSTSQYFLHIDRVRIIIHT